MRARHIGERVFLRHCRRACQTVEHCHKHRAGHGLLGAEGGFRRAGKQAVHHGVVDAVVRPVCRRRHIGEDRAGAVCDPVTGFLVGRTCEGNLLERHKAFGKRSVGRFLIQKGSNCVVQAQAHADLRRAACRNPDRAGTGQIAVILDPHRGQRVVGARRAAVFGRNRRNVVRQDRGLRHEGEGRFGEVLDRKAQLKHAVCIVSRLDQRLNQIGPCFACGFEIHQARALLPGAEPAGVLCRIVRGLRCRQNSCCALQHRFCGRADGLLVQLRVRLAQIADQIRQRAGHVRRCHRRAGHENKAVCAAGLGRVDVAAHAGEGGLWREIRRDAPGGKVRHTPGLRT